MPITTPKQGTITMLSLAVKTLIVCTIPKAVEMFYEWLDQPSEPEKKVKPVPNQVQIELPLEEPEYHQGGNTIRKSEAANANRFRQNFSKLVPKSTRKGSTHQPHKPADTYKFTPPELEFIRDKHLDMLRHNEMCISRVDRLTLLDLRDYLNKELGRDKSVTSYTNIIHHKGVYK